MSILHTSQTSEDKKIDAVIIASSDSDFSPLAFHLRAAGIDVIGMGEPGRINPMWSKACTEFVTLTPGQPLMRKRETAPSDTVVTEAPLVPVIVDPSPQPTPAESSKETPKVKVETNPATKVKESADREKENVKVIAPSHSARVQIIRDFITEQLAAHDGVMKSGELFKALASVPDYKFDQQRSRRKPLDYLEKQYSEWFVLTPGENGSYWISARQATSPAADEQFSALDRKPAVDEQSSALDEQLGVDVQPAAEEPAASSLPDDPRVALIESGIPIQDAGHVADILSESKNLFAAYNGLTKAFGRKIGSQYYNTAFRQHLFALYAPLDVVMLLPMHKHLQCRDVDAQLS